MIFLLYKSLSFSENGRKQTTARRPAARANFCSKDLALPRIRTNPAPAYQLLTPGDQGIRTVCPNYAKVIKKFIFLISFEKQAITGVFTKWTEWSKCKADCDKDPNHAVMTRTQTNLADPTDVRIQEIPCESPCPPGTDNIWTATDIFPSRLFCIGGQCQTKPNR